MHQPRKRGGGGVYAAVHAFFYGVQLRHAALYCAAQGFVISPCLGIVLLQRGAAHLGAYALLPALVRNVVAKLVVRKGNVHVCGKVYARALLYYGHGLLQRLIAAAHGRASAWPQRIA